jgi:hyperosmotically inducible periplasmic protein
MKKYCSLATLLALPFFAVVGCNKMNQDASTSISNTNTMPDAGTAVPNTNANTYATSDTNAMADTNTMSDTNAISDTNTISDTNALSDTNTMSSYGTNTAGRDVDNSGINQRDRDTNNLTPGDQGNTQSDIDLTQRIRKTLVMDTTYSMTAKNIKIIAVNGRVTLRGPVNSDSEKSGIEALAKNIAGDGNVDDQLEVKSNP